jgi:hypothetical protein
MISTTHLWYSLFVLLLAAYVYIVYKAKNRKRYLLYFVFGSLFGFYFDTVSFNLGFYSYPGIYAITIMGLPLSMTIAEGFAITITVRIAEFFKDFFDSG